MTTDEAISILNSINDLFGAEYENINPMIALNMAIAALEREQWIPCSERLPEPNHYVLIKKTDGDFTIGEYLGTEFPIQDAWFFANGEYNGRTKDIKEWKELE